MVVAGVVDDVLHPEVAADGVLCPVVGVLCSVVEVTVELVSYPVISVVSKGF